MSEVDSSEDEMKINRVGSSIEELMDSDQPITLNKKHRQMIFILICVEYCISSCDGGIIPQQNKNIQYNFIDTGESRVGLFSSIDYVGRIVGALVMSALIDKLDRRIFFSSCCIFKAVTLFVSTCTENYYWNLIARLISGIPQTLLTSYGTIWADQFGRRKRRSLMLALFQLSALGGILVGYGIGMVCDAIIPIPDEVKKYGEGKGDGIKHEYYYLGWRFAFSIEGIILAILGLIVFFCPKIFFSSTFYLNEDNDKNGDDNIGKEKSLAQIKMEKKKMKEQSKYANFILFLKQLPKILCTKIFIFMSIGNTVAFFGMRVIQFYADKYMELVLVVNKNVKFIYYTILCLTGPILGVLIIGIVMQKIGGYGSRKGMILILVLNAIADAISVVFTLTLNTFVSLASAWIYLFCLAAVTPLQGGIIIASLSKELKGNGYAVNMFFLNALGSFPSSYVFALICDFIENNYDKSNMRYRTTMRIVMFYNFVGLALIIVGAIFRFRIKGDLEAENKVKNNIEENKEKNKEEHIEIENREIKGNEEKNKEENREEINDNNIEENKEKINDINLEENKKKIKDKNIEEIKDKNKNENKDELNNDADDKNVFLLDKKKE